MILEPLLMASRKQRSRLTKRTSRKKGLPPGSLFYTGDNTAPTTITNIRYNKMDIKERHYESANDAALHVKPEEVLWSNLIGLSNTTAIHRIGETFKLNNLVLEDILHTSQRPKIEDFKDYTYLVLKMVSIDSESQIQVEQVSFILGQHYVLSFQEWANDVFGPVRERLRTDRGLIRELGPDYLFYALIDAIVDHYFVVLESLDDQLETLEQRVLSGNSDNLIEDLYRTRRNIVLLRKSVWPLRELLSALIRDKHSLIQNETLVYFRDVYDHTIQVIDTIDALRDISASIREMHTTEISLRMNNIMKVLTMIATVFIPITFVAGIYGMNFEFMPELKWTHGYQMVWFLFVSISTAMLIFFRKNRWI
ncbi:MAG: magnesium/cobalt transporter CorA [Bdellovibrionales bacterium]|nr:magnesium/cobalt transporter CorA [Bdellovibrionales bacterium]